MKLNLNLKHTHNNDYHLYYVYALPKYGIILISSVQGHLIIVAVHAQVHHQLKIAKSAIFLFCLNSKEQFLFLNNFLRRNFIFSHHHQKIILNIKKSAEKREHRLITTEDMNIF